MSHDTPMMKQYRRLKKESGDAVLFFRLGDFYEMFEEDAREVSSLLNLTFTKRNGIPMCGIPYHSSKNYIARLLKEGKKIAICEQISLPEGGKGIADRQIVEIVTPGTVLEEDILTGNRNNFLASLGRFGSHVSFAYIDSSTGDFLATSFSETVLLEKVKEEIERTRPSELLIQESLIEESDTLYSYLQSRKGLLINRFPDWAFDIEESRRKLMEELNVLNLKGFGIEGHEPALFAAGPLLDYLHETNRGDLPHINSIALYHEGGYLSMDESTFKNLELFSNMFDGSTKYSLLDILDRTRTAMGGRMLKKWIGQPLVDVVEIRKRHDTVEYLYRHQNVLNTLRGVLHEILDINRLASRVAMERAHPKDVLGLGYSLEKSMEALSLVTDTDLLQREVVPEQIEAEEIEKLYTLIENAISEEPSVVLTEGRIIREGYSPELDRKRDLQKNRKQVLENYLQEEKDHSGITNLKIKYNKIIGHFLEVSKGNLEKVPGHFIRRQSLVGSERFTTTRLGEIESELNNLSEEIVEMEKKLFLDVRNVIREKVSIILLLSDGVAQIDCFASFAYAATLHGFTRPEVNEGTELKIGEGRHPVVEHYLPHGSFVPNTLVLEESGPRFVLLTGPNMAGKSTFLRQIALITVMAQAGSFVPAADVSIGVVDRIFCRVGASDNLSRGESTFLVEMNETSYILRSATRRSLIVMDEVGRGTSTDDGLSIAWAVIEYILNVIHARTLFATHFHQLTQISHEGLMNMYMAITEKGGDIIFLKSVKNGIATNSYGIQVAKLAGLPAAVIDRAGEIMSALPENRPVDDIGRSPAESAPSRSNQSELFSETEYLIREIQSLDIDNTTPVNALQILEKLKKMASSCK